MERMPNSNAKLSLPSEREILIERDFRVAKRLLFDAWTKPEYVRGWYGCGGQSLTVCEIDLREGGKWRWVMRDTERGVDHAHSGEYREISRPDRLVFSQVYESYPASLHQVTLTFDERDGVTTQRMLLVHSSVENRDGHLKSGMQTGLDHQYDALERIARGLM